MSKNVTFNKPGRDNKIVNAEDWIKSRKLETEVLDAVSANNTATAESIVNEDINPKRKKGMIQ